MAAAGAYLILNQVQVTTSFWRFSQYGGFGLTLLPLLVGIAFLFYDGKSIAGWVLTAIGTAIILAGVLMNMDIYFRQTSLFQTLMMLGLLFGGTWTYELTPVGRATLLRITERGEVYNPVFRVMSRFVFGHTATIDAYLAALGARVARR